LINPVFRVIYVSSKTTGGIDMDRKQLIKELQLKFETKAKYLGVPSCAYEITIKGATYTIDKEGRIVTASGQEFQPEELLNEAVETGSEEVEATADTTPITENTPANVDEGTATVES
jgi:hypothetical protein